MATKHLADCSIGILGSRRTQRLIVFFLMGGFTLLTTLSIMLKPRTWSLRQTIPNNRSEEVYGHSALPGFDMKPDLEAVRSSTYSFQTTTVYCWPQEGGVWVRDNCDPVQLDFLDVSITEPAASRRYSEAEDEFCRRLSYIGGRHYPYEGAYFLDRIRREGNPHPEQYYGWPGEVPADGVWAIWLTEYDFRNLDAQHIRNASNMAERCEAIQRLGGRFFSTWTELQDHVDTYSVETRQLLDKAAQRWREEHDDTASEDGTDF